jgi:ABC-2 type transport system ATP-binding protein
VIEIKNISKKYGAHYAVKNASFTVEKGEIVGFLGRNGAGKTTTMNIITGYISSTSGSVSIDGFDILKSPMEAKRKIGYLPEHPPLYFEMTVRDYLRFACELKNVPAKQIGANMDRAMEKTRITDVAGRLVGNLSKGYKQRVGLAGALCGDPEILILDEPTVGLDPGQIIEIRSAIKDLGQDHTVILSSHILHEVADICEKVIIINKGVIVAQDRLENLTNNVNDKCRVMVRLVTGRSDGARLLKGIDGIDFAEYMGCKEPGTCDFVVEASERDVRADIFNAAVSAGIVLLGLKSMSVTLEDIFIQLTSDTEEAAV